MAGHFELSFELGDLALAGAEQACQAAGALAVTLSAADQEAVLEPWPGELKLWRATRVQALFAAERAGPSLILELATLLGIEPTRLAARAVAERVWEREWLRDFHAMRFGERLWVCPHHEQVSDPHATVVRLDPGLAFGTGTHPSTALCLQWLDATARSDAALSQLRVIDFGCGSGILGIAALRLGARRVYAHDIDPQALLATAGNARDNAVAERLEVCEHLEALPAGCELLLSNILGPTLRAQRERFAALVGRGGRLVMAGMLADEQAEMAAAFAKWFDIRLFAERDDWIALCGTRNDAPV